MLQRDIKSTPNATTKKIFLPTVKSLILMISTVSVDHSFHILQVFVNRDLLLFLFCFPPSSKINKEKKKKKTINGERESKGEMKEKWKEDEEGKS